MVELTKLVTIRYNPLVSDENAYHLTVHPNEALVSQKTLDDIVTQAQLKLVHVIPWRVAYDAKLMVGVAPGGEIIIQCLPELRPSQIPDASIAVTQHLSMPISLKSWHLRYDGKFTEDGMSDVIANRKLLCHTVSRNDTVAIAERPDILSFVTPKVLDHSYPEMSLAQYVERYGQQNNYAIVDSFTGIIDVFPLDFSAPAPDKTFVKSLWDLYYRGSSSNVAIVAHHKEAHYGIVRARDARLFTEYSELEDLLRVFPYTETAYVRNAAMSALKALVDDDLVLDFNDPTNIHYYMRRPR